MKVYENLDEDRPLFKEEENACKKCAEEHRQLSKWLRELKAYRDKYKEGEKALEQQPRWIPVSERLPEEEDEYLISVEYKPEANYENVYTERGEWVGGQWNISGFEHCGKVENIIAWCELPLPYKAESVE